MVKYKLIKEYPASPPLGTEIDENGFNGSMTTWCNPEKYPEFWEKIDEKAYKVLSFIGKVIPRIYKLQDNGVYLCEEDKQYFFTNESAFRLLNYNNEGIDIYSIKRLSDGEIFTIGDRVSFKNNNSLIKAFRLEKEALYVDFKSGNGVSIKYVEKLEQPLFTTEDGIDIFEDNNNYFYVNKNWYIDEIHNINKLNYETYHKNKPLFSTKEKAKEYVLKNKPIFSYNDIEEIVKSFYPLNINLLEKIKDKAKKIIFKK